jgi:hypothetical protein
MGLLALPLAKGGELIAAFVGLEADDLVNALYRFWWIHFMASLIIIYKNLLFARYILPPALFDKKAPKKLKLKPLCLD